MATLAMKQGIQPKLPSMNEINPNTILGYIEMHSISDIKIHKTDLEHLFWTHGMSTTHLPEKIKPHDAFRRATHTAQQSIKINNSDSPNARLLVREVVCESDRIVRHLVREIVDSHNEVLDYATVGKFEFSRESERMYYSWDHAYLDEYNYVSILQEIEQLFLEWTQYHTKDTVRNIVNRIVESMNPVGFMARGKAMFIPKHQAENLKSLKSIIDDLSFYAHETDQKPIMEIIPMIDTVEQRNLLHRRIEIEISDGLDSVITEMRQALQNRGTLRASTVERYINNVRDLKRKAKDYEELLAVRLEIVQTQIEEAFDNIEAYVETDETHPNNNYPY